MTKIKSIHEDIMTGKNWKY